MNEKLNKSEEISGYNKNIIAALTHDLKSPAVAQIKALELLLKGNFGEINDSQKSFIKDIIDSGHNMLDMLVNMLLLYKFDNNKIAINITKFNINDLIKDIFVENKLIFQSKNHKFELLLDKNNQYIAADKMHIKRIITNLIINAVTHGQNESLIKIITKEENKNLVFEVESIGGYVSKELLSSIFDKNKVFTLKSEGLSTGLGLYLCNSLLELNKGKFIYKSEKKDINTFGFSIKLPSNSFKKTDTKKACKSI